jgi:hypothetical protein
MTYPMSSMGQHGGGVCSCHQAYDPATSFRSPYQGSCWGCGCPCCVGATPGGNSTITWANEKGVQEYNNHMVVMSTTRSKLGSDHDSYAQGIYETDPMTGQRDLDD